MTFGILFGNAVRSIGGESRAFAARVAAPVCYTSKEEV